MQHIQDIFRYLLILEKIETFIILIRQITWIETLEIGCY